MVSVRYKSDYLRFKEINSLLIGNEILDVGSDEGLVHQLLVKHNPKKKIFTLDKNSMADFNIDLDYPKKVKKKFDTIIAGEIIEHIIAPISFIQYCKSLLKKNGRIILTTPNAAGLQYILDPAWCVYYKTYRGHTQAFTPDMLKRMFIDEGFKIHSCKYLNAFWINNPLQYLSYLIKRLRPDILIAADKF